MQITVKMENLAQVRQLLADLSGPQMRKAYAKAINDTAFEVRRAMQAEMAQVFNQPTAYILKSSYVQMATPNKLSARIAPENKRDSVGVDPQKILQAQEFGGSRRDKRSEVAFRRAGLLLPGWQMVMPSDPYPGSHDGKGNLKGAFLSQLISYFRVSAEQGYSANISDKRKRAIERGTKKTVGRRYFVSFGRLRGQHLAPGIWAASGTHGVDVRPVVMFTRAGRYAPRLSMERIAEKVDVQGYMDRRLRFRIREAAGV